MIPLPPYHLYFNPTELVFNTLVQRFSSFQAKYNSTSEKDFYREIIAYMSSFSLNDVISFFWTMRLSLIKYVHLNEHYCI